jgi:hypothetical protein
MNRDDTLPREGPVPEVAHRQHRRRCAPFPPHVRAVKSAPRRSSRRSPGSSSPRVPADDSRRRCRRGRRCTSPSPRRSRSQVRPEASRSRASGDRHEQEPDRHVEPEDPLPRTSLRRPRRRPPAARHGQAADRAQAPRARPRFSASTAPRGSSGSDGVTIAPRHPAPRVRDQGLDVRSEGGCRRGDGEDPEPDREEPPRRSGRRAQPR